MVRGKALSQFKERKRKPETFDVLLGNETKPETSFFFYAPDQNWFRK